MQKLRIIGVVAPIQTGKVQLAHVFPDMGYAFHNLNNAVHSNRVPGTPRHEYYQSLIPGSLDGKGFATATFYAELNPKLYAQLLAEETEVAIRAGLHASRQGGRMALSWEYLDRITDKVPVEHMLVFHSTQEVWHQRLKRRAQKLTGGRWIPEDGVLDELIRTLQLEPERILESVQTKFPPNQYTLVDVSPQDWGEQNLRQVLQRWQ